MPDRLNSKRLPVDVSRRPFAAHPLISLATAFAVGIVGGWHFAVPLFLLILPAAIATLAAGFAIFELTECRWCLRARNRTRIATGLSLLAILLLGAALATIEKSRAPANQLRSLIEKGAISVGDPVEITGVLERDREVGPERLYLQLRLERIRSHEIEQEVSGVVMLLASVPTAASKQEFDQLDLRYGARLRVMTRLERSDSFRNPGVSSFTEYLDRKGYDATGFVKSPLLIERLDNERVFLPLRWLYEWRRRLQTEIDARFSSETAGVLDAALLGNRYNLSRSTSERFREGGTFHVLVISGLHITFLGGLAFLIARRFTSNAVLQFSLAVVVLWAYALAVGAESSVVRAALMFTLVLFAPLVSRRAASLNALGGTALVLLAWRPGDLFDPSFQLTFVSVLAIVVIAWPLTEKLAAIGSWRPTRETPYPPSCSPWLLSFCESLYWSERKAKRELERANYSYRLLKTPLAGTLERLHLQRPLRYAFGAILVSFVVQLALVPFLVIYFHRLSFASILLNIGVSLLLAAIAIIAAAALLLAQLSATLAAPLISLTNSLNWLMVHSVDPFARAGIASLRLPEYSGWASALYGLYYLPFALLVFSLTGWKPFQLSQATITNKRRRRIRYLTFVGQLLALVLIGAHPFSAGSATRKLRVDFLDVGQGDSALITFPDNTTLLIDGGGRPGPFQKESRSGANEAVDESFDRETSSIGESVVSEYLWWRGLDQVDYLLATHADADHIDGLNDVARNFSVRAALVARTPGNDDEYAQFAETLAARNIPLRLIGAGDWLRVGEVTAKVLWPLPAANGAPSRNNDSVVLLLQFGERTLLLTGDLEMAGEQGILRAGENLQADVVKVAHHGSRTSSTAAFVTAVRPRIAVISVGQTSIFGHPNAEVVESWRNIGAQVLTTGNSGTITITTNGRDLVLEKFVDR